MIATLNDFLQEVALMTDIDNYNANAESVVMMTIHSAKGLEFPVVFIAGAEEGLIPHARSVDDNGGNVEEERRLFYVAITRARHKLLISSCQKRRKQQAIVECTPSRFLDEIPTNLVEYHEPSKEVSQEKGHEFLMNMLNKFK